MGGGGGGGWEQSKKTKKGKKKERKRKHTRSSRVNTTTEHTSFRRHNGLNVLPFMLESTLSLSLRHTLSLSLSFLLRWPIVFHGTLKFKTPLPFWLDQNVLHSARTIYILTMTTLTKSYQTSTVGTWTKTDVINFLDNEIRREKRWGAVCVCVGGGGKRKNC